jgi:hypothetical protein
MSMNHFQQLGVTLFCGAICLSLLHAQQARLDWKQHNVGKVRQVVTNMGTMNKALTNFPGLVNSEFPPNSNEEHLYQAGLWVGGINPNGDTLVSETQSHYRNEFFPTASRSDTIWSVARGETVQIPYWQNYVGISDQDFVCRYSDDNLTNIENHTPLHVEVIQTSHAWSSTPVDEFIVFKYKVIPKVHPIKKMYLGFWIHSAVGVINTANFIDENLFYDRDLHMTTVVDTKGGDDGTAISPLICRVLAPTTPGLTWTWGYYEHETMPNTNVEEYLAMSNGNIMENRSDQPARGHVIHSFGPFDVNVGDTVNVEMALVFGYGVKAAVANAKYLDFLKLKGFKVPSPPPVPIVKVTPRNKGIHLTWYPPADSTKNPEKYTDPNRGDSIKYPFEGYRVYKSSKGRNGPWTLMAQYDVIDDIPPNTGLTTYEYEEIGLLNNVEYYYAVTAYSKPDNSINFPSQETSTSATALVVTPGTQPPATVGQVYVVPNPYRGDIAYNSYDPPWEKPGGSRTQWMEQDRKIQFVNLPHSCDIKIYTLSGDLVYTIRHHEFNKGYENWNLTSSVGQAVSSGLYLFTVEDKTNGKVQAGKFVIIK